MSSNLKNLRGISCKIGAHFKELALKKTDHDFSKKCFFDMKVFCILSTDFKGHLNISEITRKVKRQKSQAVYFYNSLFNQFVPNAPFL